MTVVGNHQNIRQDSINGISPVAYHYCKFSHVSMFSLVSVWVFHSILGSIGWVLLAICEHKLCLAYSCTGYIFSPLLLPMQFICWIKTSASVDFYYTMPSSHPLLSQPVKYSCECMGVENDDSVLSYSFSNESAVCVSKKLFFLIVSSAYSVCGLVHLFVTLLSVVSELVNRSLVGNKSAKLVEMWKNKRHLGRTKRLLVAVE